MVSVNNIFIPSKPPKKFQEFSLVDILKWLKYKNTQTIIIEVNNNNKTIEEE